MSVAGRLIFAAPPTTASYGTGGQFDDWIVEVVGSGPELSALLADRYDVGLVVVDLAVVDDRLLDGLQSPGAPPAIFLLRDQYERITMSPNVIAYLDADAPAAAIRAAVAAALPARALAAVGDFSDRDAQRLNSLGREVERIARALSELATASQAEALLVSPVDSAAVRAVIKRRRERERYFPAELFSDPAWDMLLDLTAARLERRLVSVSSLCIAAAVPTTTALRWIRNLCEIGLFERNIDPDDARRGLISLSDDAANRMFAYLGAKTGTGAA